ncbi:MAG: endonuclease III [Deltaproteobacteria bacterium]
MDTKEKAKRVLDILEDEFPGAAIELHFKNPLELLIATILSAQATDKLVNKVTASLFHRYRTVHDYAGADIGELEKALSSVNYFRNKAKNIKASCRIIEDRYAGSVPATIEDLTGLPGVGRKTANVVLANGFGKEALAVDTHVKRVAKRLGLTGSDKPDEVEKDLCGLIPRSRWSMVTMLFILHGRKTCISRNPACDRCHLARYCLYYKEVYRSK